MTQPARINSAVELKQALLNPLIVPKSDKPAILDCCPLVCSVELCSATTLQEFIFALSKGYTNYSTRMTLFAEATDRCNIVSTKRKKLLDFCPRGVARIVCFLNCSIGQQLRLLPPLSNSIFMGS